MPPADENENQEQQNPSKSPTPAIGCLERLLSSD